MNTKYFMFCLVNFMSFVNIHPFLSFRPATHSKKSWDRASNEVNWLNDVLKQLMSTGDCNYDLVQKQHPRKV